MDYGQRGGQWAFISKPMISSLILADLKVPNPQLAMTARIRFLAISKV